MKKILIVVALIALSLGSFSCGGGGAGSPDVPPGENPGTPSVVQLSPSHYIAQFNASITLHTKVLDGNGIPVPNIPVIYTNLSSIGTLSATSANTNSLGIATVTLFSSTPGFATILAQVNTGVGQVRDQKAVFFTSNDILAVRLALDVDADNDLIYDEASDILLGETSSDTSVKIRARVYDAGGVLLAGRLVQFDAERAYRVGTSILGTDTTWPCSDESNTCYIAFPLSNTAYTNENGEAFTQMLVGVESLRNFTTNLNIFAQADNGASDMKTLFISPVTVSSITVTANPSVIPPSTSGTASTSTITAIAMTNTNQPVPDGTTINFSIDSACAAAGGTITPFGRTGVAAKGDGKATATFTAPSSARTCTITAAVGSVSGTITITVTTALNVLPASATINTGAACALPTTKTATYTISGGIAPYTVSTSHPGITSFTAPATGNTITVTAAPWQFTIEYDVVTTADTTVTITVVDTAGTSKTATFIIDCP